MIDQLEKIQTSCLGDLESNAATFLQFKNHLKNSIKFENGDVLAAVEMICYRGHKLHRFTGSVLLIDHGACTGNIGIANDALGFQDESLYAMMDISLVKYSLGRTTLTLIIENGIGKIHDTYHRIEIEEQRNQFERILN